MSVASPPRLTPDDLLSHPDRRNYELVDGRFVELNVSQESSWIAGEVYAHLRDHVKSTDAGWVFPEGSGYQCFADDPFRVRKPDASFISKARQPAGPTKSGFGRVIPDLVVEVVSPNDLAWEVELKVNEWLEAGVGTVWVVMPPSRSVTVHRAGSKPQLISAREDLTLPDLLPGFSCRVGELFPTA